MNREVVSVSGEAALEANLRASRSASTRRAYDAAWRAFRDYAGPVLPADPKTVAIYLSALGERAKPATVQLHAAAIAAIHKDNGLESPTEHPGVKKAMEGHANRVGTAPKQASPIDAEAYEKITATAMEPRRTRGGRTETVEEAQFRGLVDACLIGVMRDALLRRSEASALRWEDLEPQTDGSGRLTIRFSKTDQSGKSAVRYVSPILVEILLCLWAVSNAAAEDSMFGLSSSQISRRIATACAQAGLRGEFSGHSPRIGMAHDLAKAGFGITDIMQVGRWKSSAMPAYYVRCIEEGKSAVARYYAAMMEASSAK